MQRNKRFSEAIKQIDAANMEDPRAEIVEGRPQPRELLFAQRVYRWVEQLVEQPSEELLLAARAHTLRRWKIPRERYPMTTVGYHQWRDVLAQFHADEAEPILRAANYPDDQIQKVRAFITKANWPDDKEACALEDADCLVFLDAKLKDYLDTWDESKTLRILRRTLRKMTPDGRTQAFQLELGDRARELVRRAALPASAGSAPD